MDSKNYNVLRKDRYLISEEMRSSIEIGANMRVFTGEVTKLPGIYIVKFAILNY